MSPAAGITSALRSRTQTQQLESEIAPVTAGASIEIDEDSSSCITKVAEELESEIDKEPLHETEEEYHTLAEENIYDKTDYPAITDASSDVSTSPPQTAEHLTSTLPIQLSTPIPEPVAGPMSIQSLLKPTSVAGAASISSSFIPRPPFVTTGPMNTAISDDHKDATQERDRTVLTLEDVCALEPEFIPLLAKQHSHDEMLVAQSSSRVKLSSPTDFYTLNSHADQPRAALLDGDKAVVRLRPVGTSGAVLGSTAVPPVRGSCFAYEAIVTGCGSSLPPALVVGWISAKHQLLKNEISLHSNLAFSDCLRRLEDGAGWHGLVLRDVAIDSGIENIDDQWLQPQLRGGSVVMHERKISEGTVGEVCWKMCAVTGPVCFVA
jgi:hypothetical protein